LGLRGGAGARDTESRFVDHARPLNQSWLPCRSPNLLLTQQAPLALRGFARNDGVWGRHPPPAPPSLLFWGGEVFPVSAPLPRGRGRGGCQPQARLYPRSPLRQIRTYNTETDRDHDYLEQKNQSGNQPALCACLGNTHEKPVNRELRERHGNCPNADGTRYGC
jgi:hypothetical protein